MAEKTVYYISEASKLVQVEPHVLRYWEDELALPIGRNEMGHRSYTQEDIERFRQIKHLKEQGLQLRAIRMVLHGEYAFPLTDNGETSKHEEAMAMHSETTPLLKGGEIEKMDQYEVVEHEMQEKVEDMIMKKAKKYMVTMTKGKETVMELPREEMQEYEDPADDEKAKKAARLQYLLQHLVTDAVKNANREMCTEIKESILKELDYQFRQQEERDEAHWKQEEEHYRKIDEMIRQRHQPKERFGIGKKKEPLPQK
ncbi:MAG: helix-turn-helix domain-containing protein [Lachnospiraceae bacterium]|nr:helix-turn-helix domain-containing protein [Lachnospiraceae bacterium]